MFQTMEGNAAPHRVIGSKADSEAELLSTLQAASENIMRLAGKLLAGHDASAQDAVSITEQNELAQLTIGRLLALPASKI
ncbi:hypothetical protein [Caballeronia sp. TF1N1]|uniref:hypothetical protein n=1 Tax=Caballeronia sp. TF1N1 TaxID=2878153 RepID=UPI001FD2A9D7|nr:hypothetical protein [Caballeronia sp. TF1N1]